MHIARIVLGIAIAAAAGGALYFLATSRFSLASALVPVIAWGFVLLRYAPGMPFFATSRPALAITIAIFGIAAAFFFALCAYVASVQLPKMAAPHFDGLVVAQGVQFRDEQGAVRTIPAEATAAKPLQPGDHVRVSVEEGRYFVVRRDEARIFWFLTALLGACFLVTGSAAIIAATRYAQAGGG